MKDIMMKRFALVAVSLAAAGIGYATHPVETTRYAGWAVTAAARAWESIEANPVPVAFALGTFLLTVVYHKAKGKSLRESVEVAATRVTVVPVPVPDLGVDDNPVVRRARARATRTQLLADQIGLQNRHRKLPEEVTKAEKEACYTEQALAGAELSLAERRKAHDDAVARLEELRKERAAADAELAEIEGELKKLSELV
jgi:hypothetical protein